MLTITGAPGGLGEEHGRGEIRQRLAHAGAGLGHEVPAGLERRGDAGGHLGLLGALLVGRHGRLERPAGLEEFVDLVQVQRRLGFVVLDLVPGPLEAFDDFGVILEEVREGELPGARGLGELALQRRRLGALEQVLERVAGAREEPVHLGEHGERERKEVGREFFVEGLEERGAMERRRSRRQDAGATIQPVMRRQFLNTPAADGRLHHRAQFVEPDERRAQSARQARAARRALQGRAGDFGLGRHPRAGGPGELQQVLQHLAEIRRLVEFRVGQTGKARLRHGQALRGLRDARPAFAVGAQGLQAHEVPFAQRLAGGQFEEHGSIEQHERISGRPGTVQCTARRAPGAAENGSGKEAN
ncbi:MAG: hypothetical protein M5U26_16715 [Planctomycetota bacterium]|nr:hypothetical protein [Planctomycetota bacterium]